MGKVKGILLIKERLTKQDQDEITHKLNELTKGQILFVFGENIEFYHLDLD